MKNIIFSFVILSLIIFSFIEGKDFLIEFEPVLKNINLHANNKYGLINEGTGRCVLQKKLESFNFEYFSNTYRNIDQARHLALKLSDEIILKINKYEKSKEMLLHYPSDIQVVMLGINFLDKKNLNDEIGHKFVNRVLVVNKKIIYYELDEKKHIKKFYSETVDEARAKLAESEKQVSLNKLD